MNVTRDVISDLLPVYYSGEASDDTKALVDEFLRVDPAFAEVVRKGEQATTEIESAGKASPALGPSIEARALNGAKRILRRRTAYLSSALLFTLWPLSFAIDEHGVRFLFKGTPIVAVMMWMAAAAFWTGYWRLNRLSGLLRRQ